MSTPLDETAHTPRNISIQQNFAASVWRLVKRIPYGRVTTYGHLAKQLGYPRHSRMVGQSLRLLPSEKALPTLHDGTPNPDFVPWHRVINAQGCISARGSRQAEERQAAWLEEEGVEVQRAAGYGIQSDSSQITPDRGRVKLSVYGWFP